MERLVAQRFEDSKAVQPGHLDVQHQKVELSLAEEVERFLPIPRLGNIPIPQGLEHEDHQGTQLVGIFHHQNRRVLARNVGLGEVQLG